MNKQLLKHGCLGSLVLMAFGYANNNDSRAARTEVTSSLTAQDQIRGSREDVELTRKIRSSIIEDKVLSADARNVKIITLNRRVTLKGMVGSPAEEASVLKHARKFADASQVKSEIVVRDESPHAP